MLFITQRVARGGVFEADCGGDITRVNSIDILAVIGVHLKDAPEALVIVLRGVINGGTRADGAGIHAEEAELANERVGGDLEGEGREGLVVRRMALALFIGFRVHTLDRGNVGRSRHVIHDRIQQLLNALVAVRGAAAHRYHFIGDGALADAHLDFIDGELFAVEILHEDLVILLRHCFEQLCAVFIGKLLQIVGDGLLADILPEVVVINIGVHLHEVDYAPEGIFTADRQLDRDRVAFETVVHHLDDTEEIGAHDVHLINIGHTRDVVFLSLAPYGFGLGLNAALRTENGNGTIQHAQGTLNFNGEVDVARGVDDVDPVLFPEAGGSGGGDGDATLLLLLHPVHSGCAFVNLANLVRFARIEQDTLGCRGFTSVDMGHNANVSCHLKGYFSWHIVLLKNYVLAVKKDVGDFPTGPILPAVMGKRLVGFRHAMRVFTLLGGAAGTVACIEDFSRETFLHGALGTGAAVSREPAQTEGLAAFRTDFDRNLVSGAAHAAGLYLQQRHDVLHGLLKHLEGFFAGLFTDNIERAVDDLLGNALLAVIHDIVDKTCYKLGIVKRIRQNISFCDLASSWHFASLLHRMIS